MATIVRRNTDAAFGKLVAAAGSDALACVWLFLSAFLFAANYAFFANNVVTGGVAALFAFFGPFAHRWLVWVPLGIALWVTVSPFVLGFTEHTIAAWNNVLTGIVMFALAARSGVLSKQAHDAGVLPE